MASGCCHILNRVKAISVVLAILSILDGTAGSIFVA
jgi:hypothetical protein